MDAGLRALAWNGEEDRLRAPFRLGLAAVLLLALATAIQEVALRLGLAASGLGSLGEAVWVTLVTAGGLAAAILGVVAVARWLDRRRLADLGAAVDRAWLVEATVGVAVGAGMVTAVVAVAVLAGVGSVSGVGRVRAGPVGLTAGTALLDAAFWLVVFLGAGALEEVLFRGYLLVNAAEGLAGYAPDPRRAVLGGVGASAGAFGLAHAANPGGSVLGVGNVVLFGLLFGATVAATGRLGLAVGLHVAWNATLGLGFGLPVSGIDTGAALVAVELSGPAVLTGGRFGPEGGLLAVVGLLAGIAAAGWFLWRRGDLGIETELATPSLRGRSDSTPAAGAAE